MKRRRVSCSPSRTLSSLPPPSRRHLPWPGSPAREIVVEAACTFTGPVEARKLSAIDLRVFGRVPGLDSAAFGEAAAAARLQALRSGGARGRPSRGASCRARRFRLMGAMEPKRMGELGRLRVGSASRRNADSQIDTLRAGRHAEILSRRRMQASSAGRSRTRSSRGSRARRAQRARASRAGRQRPQPARPVDQGPRAAPRATPGRAPPRQFARRDRNRSQGSQSCPCRVPPATELLG